MILVNRLIKPIAVTVARTGAVIQIPAGAGGAFIVHRGEPVTFFFNDEMCQLSVQGFCDATGKTLDSLESILALDCDHDEYDNAVLDGLDEDEAGDD
jgi:hypothetical protein